MHTMQYSKKREFLNTFKNVYTPSLTARPWAERGFYLGQNSNEATYDVQGQQKSQITKLTLSKKIHSKP